jgi:hypothetical protein
LRVDPQRRRSADEDRRSSEAVSAIAIEHAELSHRRQVAIARTQLTPALISVMKIAGAGV